MAATENTYILQGPGSLISPSQSAFTISKVLKITCPRVSTMQPQPILQLPERFMISLPSACAMQNDGGESNRTDDNDQLIIERSDGPPLSSLRQTGFNYVNSIIGSGVIGKLLCSQITTLIARLLKTLLRHSLRIASSRLRARHLLVAVHRSTYGLLAMYFGQSRQHCWRLDLPGKTQFCGTGLFVAIVQRILLAGCCASCLWSARLLLDDGHSVFLSVHR